MSKHSNVPVKHDAPQQEVMPPFMTLRREIDRLFDDFFSLRPFRAPFAMEPFQRWAMGDSGAMHHADFVEHEDRYEITVEVPGMKEKDLSVAFTDSMLTVRGETAEEKEEKKADYYLSERRRGSFSRRFSLPDGVDTDKVEASLRQGVLTITLPKKPEAMKKEKKVEIKTAAE